MSEISKGLLSSESISLTQFIPEVDNKAALSFYLNSVGISGMNEFQRSDMYRIPAQIRFLREYMQGLSAETSLDILNIGPANAEEATVLAIIANNNGMLKRSDISYVDLATLDMVHPIVSRGKNFLGQPIPPSPADANSYVLESETWNLKPDIQDFINSSLNKPDNHFSTAIENYCKTPDPKKYSIVTFNNVAQYLGIGLTKYDNPFYKREGDFSTFQAVILSVAEKTAIDGILLAQITSGGVDSRRREDRGDKFAVDKYLHEGTNFDDVFETINPKEGIYKRKSAEPLVMKLING